MRLTLRSAENSVKASDFKRLAANKSQGAGVVSIIGGYVTISWKKIILATPRTKDGKVYVSIPTARGQRQIRHPDNQALRGS